MKLKLRTICCLLLLALLPTQGLSQQPRKHTRRPASSQTKYAERARLAAEAATLLTETADKARSFDDLLYRALIQMLAADALWPHDSRQARALFRRAWEAAEASDKAEEEEAAREAGALPGSVRKVTEARDEVLARAAVRDARLAETFLRELTAEADASGANRNEGSRRSTWRDLSAGAKRRLALAYEMLEGGKPQRAAEIAAAVVAEGVNIDMLTFIARLSPSDFYAADRLYQRLLERAAADPATDANAVLMLSSRFVSPRLLVAVDEFGSLQFRSLPDPLGSFSGFYLPTPSGKEAFYNLAASVLSRPAKPGDGAMTMQDLMARFYTTGRLLPFFENSSAPYAAYAPSLRALHSQLFNEIEAGRREQVSAQFDINSLTPAGYIDPLRTQSDQLARASDAYERERIALSIIRTAVRNRFWDRARRAAAEIEDLEHRKSALSFIQVHQIKDILRAYDDDKEDDFESVARFVRAADVPPFAKAWGMAQASVVAARKKGDETRQIVVGLLTEAEEFASRVGQGTPERVAAYGVVLTTAAQFEQERAWRLLHELVKAANSAEDFTGDEVSIDLSGGETSAGGAGDGSSAAEAFSVEAEVFRLDSIFATMARLDFDKALAEARALDGEVPRALAIIAIAKSRIQERSNL